MYYLENIKGQPKKPEGFMKFLRLLFILPLLTLLACSSTGTKKIIFLNGDILNSGEFVVLEVEVEEDGRTRDSADVEPDGSFDLNFNADSGLVDLKFIGDEITIIRPNFSVTDDSTIELDVTLQINPINVIINSWVVFQDPISFRGEDTIIFNDTEADIIINGDGDNCIRTRDDSIVDFRVKTIDLSNCDEGVRTENSSQVTLFTDQSLTIFSESNGIRSREESSVSIGQVFNANNNSVEVRSFDDNGVNTTGTAVVTFTPQNNNCTIRGADDAVNEGSDSTVDIDGCTLVDG
jgi:hypothetical protein